MQVIGDESAFIDLNELASGSEKRNWLQLGTWNKWVIEDLVWLLLPEMSNYTYKAVKVWCLFCSCYQFDRC